MPTLRQRHMITETDDIAQALDDAAAAWPEHMDRSTLIKRLILEGAMSLHEKAEAAKALRLAAVQSAAGSMTGIWPTNWREEMLSEWPE